MFLSIASILEVTVFRDKLIVSKSFILSGHKISQTLSMQCLTNSPSDRVLLLLAILYATT